MFAAATFFGSSARRPNLTNRALADINAGTKAANAYVVFNTNGTLTVVNGAGSSTLTDEWMTGAISAAEAQAYDLVVTITSGALDYGSPGTTQLGVSPLSFGCAETVNGGSSQATATFAIVRRSDSLTMATATMSFEAISSNQ